LFRICSLAHQVAKPRPVATHHVVPQAAIADEEQGDDHGNVAGAAINAAIGDTVGASGNALNQLRVAQQERVAKDCGRIKVFLDNGLSKKFLRNECVCSGSTLRCKHFLCKKHINEVHVMLVHCPCLPDKPWLKWGVIVFFVLLVAVGLLLPWSIFGEKSFLINRYYSAKTLHMHKVTPNHWNSLGSMYPYFESAE
jgi:hypothetical protein